MALFFYASGDVVDMPAGEVGFEASVGLEDEDGGFVRAFDRIPAHLPGRLNVVFVERGCPRDFHLHLRVREALEKKYPKPKSLAPTPGRQA